MPDSSQLPKSAWDVRTWGLGQWAALAGLVWYVYSIGKERGEAKAMRAVSVAPRQALEKLRDREEQ